MIRWPPAVTTGIAYRQPVDSVLGPLAAAGFRVLEVATAPHHLDLDRRPSWTQTRRRAEDLGMRIHSLHAPFGPDIDITSHEPALRERALDRLLRAADALAALSGPGLPGSLPIYVIHPGPEDAHWVRARAARLAASVEGLGRLIQGCRERGVRLVVETPLPHLLGGQPEDFAWIHSRLPPGTGVCLDTSHLSLGGFLDQALETLAPHLAHVQLSDNHGHTDDHLPPGEGRLDWAQIVRGLGRAGYTGPLMLEVAGSDDLAESARRARAGADHLQALAARLIPTSP